MTKPPHPALVAPYGSRASTRVIDGRQRATGERQTPLPASGVGPSPDDGSPPVPIQTVTYKKRLRTSALSPQARLVALTIADLRYESPYRPHQGLPLTLQQLADACGMSRRGVVRYLNECLESGWIAGCAVFRDGRQKPNEYWIADPDADDTECRRLHSVIASRGPILSAGVAHNVRRRLHTVVRSNNKGASDSAPQSAGAVSDEQGTPERDADPVPDLGGSDTDPAHVTESDVLDEWQAQHRDAKTAGCRHCGTGHAVESPYGLYAGRSNTNRSRLYECSDCGLPWPKPHLVA